MVSMAASPMLRAVITGPRTASLRDMAPIDPPPGWALVRVETAPMCTEYQAFLAGDPAEFLGHEAAGEVIATGGSARVHVGQRVVAMPLFGCGSCPMCIQGDYLLCPNNDHATRFSRIPAFARSLEGSAGMAQVLLKPDFLLVPIPDGMTYDHASMACCALGATFGAMQRLLVTPFHSVLVTGLGPVGLGAVINARYRGARVIAVEPDMWRAALGRKLGASEVLDPDEPALLGRILELTGGDGPSRAVECSGSLPAQRLCIDAVRRGGAVAFVANSFHQTPIEVSPDLLFRGVSLLAAWHYNLGDAGLVMQEIRDVGPSLDLLISHSYPLSRIQEAFETQVRGECGKVLLKPWDQA